MKTVELRPDFESWRNLARELLVAQVPPDQIAWVEGASQRSLLAEVVEQAAPPPGRESPSIAVPRAFVELAQRAASHSDPARWALLYRVLWRLVHEDRMLLESDDRDVQALRLLTTTAPVSARSFIPKTDDIGELRKAAATCMGCDLYKTATQTVFGAGPANASVVFVGEQPGDVEDVQGLPFVGPAGDVLSRALNDLGISRAAVYVTNVVKHFRWEPRGKRRIHLTPRPQEIEACRPWLEAEIALLKPSTLVCLGATAAQALLGPQFRITKSRGVVFDKTRWAPWVMATIHPSAVLRADEEAAQEMAYAGLVADLRKVADRLASLAQHR